MKIGDTIYTFDINRRVYDKPGLGGSIIYREHFRPHVIVGETKLSWVTDRGGKAKKKASTPRERGGFFTAEEVEDDVWQHSHRHRLRDLLDRADPKTLRKVADVLGYVS